MHPWKISLIYLLFFSGMIFVNYSVGSQVGQVANQDPALIQPAGYAFSIWGLIYLLLFVWIIKGFFARDPKADLYRELRFMIPLNFVLNSLWIITFTQQMILLSAGIIILLLLSLVGIYQKVHRHKTSNTCDYAPFSIYTGWVSLASIVNVFTYVERSNALSFIGIGEAGWTLVAVLGISLVAISIILYQRDLFYPLVLIWTFSAIIINLQSNALQWVLIGCIIIVSAFILYSLFTRLKRRRYRIFS
ncbi:tryptophan-rich sensory protein [Oceanobacillus picturae]|uniref:tryptophan-rich sensory protein n=1 Tax=Oceanobacillus picturae TaxID=171693 RepID=UPI00363352DA